jgi:hypothetical protein
MIWDELLEQDFQVLRYGLGVLVLYAREGERQDGTPHRLTDSKVRDARTLPLALSMWALALLRVRPTNAAHLNLPQFGRHPRSHESAVGVCHGQTQAAGVHEGV